ncbi:hypothetical protein MAH1_23370 [Sessilibacter sp. MAH1]
MGSRHQRKILTSQTFLLKMLRKYLRTIKTALFIHYNAPLSEIFKQFRLGASIFFVGMVGVYAAKQIPSSLTQEALLAISLLTVSIGFLIAILAHIRMTISRILRFITGGSD